MSKSAFRRAASAAALVGAAALITPTFANAFPTGSAGSSSGSAGSSDAPACAPLSTEATPAGWGIPFDDEKGQEAAYTADNVLDENGSLKLEVTDTADRSAWYHAAGGVKLADILNQEISFAEKAPTSRASVQVRLLGTTGGKFENGFTTLVWVAAGNDAVDTAAGGMHTGLQNGKWWSTQNIDGAPGRVPVELDVISEANPNATVEHYGVSIGTGTAATSTLVDAVTFNGCTTDFALNDPEPAGSLGGSLGDLFGSSS
ncbi:hypothetical protein [Rhodococcus sp. NPDC058514]|uniref:hypothetical protein n=1 Tax=unclassified Rhodococcus (in: high G+C Gram-positive bacteria) TaxID=192944 RepID=UPI00364D2AC7